jgi:hypothetical protein
VTDSPSLFDLANRVVPMATACRLAGLDVPPIRSNGTKIHCPFGELYHPDGGREPAMRVWSDHAWCFSCSEWFGPVKITSRLWDVTEEQAAVRLLDEVGYRPASYAQLWATAAAPTAPDVNALAQALGNFCAAQEPKWTDRQLEPPVAEYLSRCYALLGMVTDESEAEQWLRSSKQVMAAILRARVP